MNVSASVKIVVSYHKDSAIVSNDVYTPIQVGRSISKVTLPFMGDDTGDNISSLNGIYCELTGLYWAWKNLDADYIGLCHYRRFFQFDSHKHISAIIKHSIIYYSCCIGYFFKRRCANVMGYLHSVDICSPKCLLQNANEFSSLIQRWVSNNCETLAFALHPVRLGNLTNFYFFSMVAGKEHINIISEIVEQNYPEIYPYLIHTLNSNKLYYANMVIMRKDVLNGYCSFLFDVLKQHCNYCLDNGIVMNLEEKAISRLMGYMSEYLTSSYISYLIGTKGKGSVKLLTMLKYTGV